MAVDKSQFEIHVATTADLAGLDATIAKLKGQIEATKQLGQDTANLDAELEKLQGTKIQRELAEITGKMGEVGEGGKKAAEGTGEFLEGHHGLHAIGHALNQALPGFMQFTRFLTSGFTGAIGGVLLLFELLKSKVEEFDKALDSLNSGPGARGEWAEKLAESERTAALASASLEHELRGILEAQASLSQQTDQLIARQKAHAESVNSIAEAEKALKEARVALAEKLGQITHEQALKIKLEIDDEDFKRNMQARIEGLKAELSLRLQEQSLASGSLGFNKDLVDQRRKEAEDAANAQTRNEKKLEQDKQNLADAKNVKEDNDKWLEENPDDLGHKLEGPERKIRQQMAEQNEGYIANLKKSIKQEEGKQKPLALASQEANEQLEDAVKQWKETASTIRETAKTIDNLKASLVGLQAESAALLQIHNQTAAVTRASEEADLRNRVNSGHGTPAEQQQVSDLDRQHRTANETGPMAGLRAADTIAIARSVANNARGQAMSSVDHAELHNLLQDILGYQINHTVAVQQQARGLEEVRRQLNDLESSYQVNNGSTHN